MRWLLHPGLLLFVGCIGTVVVCEWREVRRKRERSDPGDSLRG